MSKLINFIMITTILVLLSNYAGLLDENDNASSTYLFNTLDIKNPESFLDKRLFTIIGALGIISLVGVAASFIRGATVTESILIVGKVALVGIALLIVSDMIIIFSKMASTGGVWRAIAVLVFSPLLIYFGLAIVEWLTE